jgi:hypothetical protein
MERFLLKDQFFAPLQRALQVPPDKIPRPGQNAAVYPELHGQMLNNRGRFDEPDFNTLSCLALGQ